MTRLVLLLLALLAPALCADELTPRKGAKLEGAAREEADGQVFFNIYWSRNPGVTNPEHIFRFSSDGIKKFTRAPHPEVEVFRRIQAAQTSADLVEAGRFAKDHKLKHHARLCFGLALAKSPDDADALKAIGSSKWKSLRKGRPAFDTRIRTLLTSYAAESDLTKRKAIAKELKSHALPLKPHELERYHRATLQPTGYQEDRPLAWNAPAHPGAVYTLFVPNSYDSSVPTPLIIGLHGGGPDGAQGDEVVGSGPSAMNFYRRQAQTHGVIVACPTAMQAGWGNKPNEQLVRDVMQELRALYHIDTDRIYLTGHSMGGFGTWSLGPRLAEIFAAVSPMAGAGRGGVSRLVETRTPIFIYHSADDFISVAQDRAAAAELKAQRHDFVYTEFPNAGHGFPDSVQAELFEFFGPRRRFRKGAKDLWPQSSFRGAVSKDERLYVGDPSDAWNGKAPDVKAWLSWMRLGGGRALQAIDPIVQAQPDGVAAALAKIATQTNLPFDARGYAARCLGQLGAKDQGSTLEKVVTTAPSKNQSFVASEAAQALAALGVAAHRRGLDRAIDLWAEHFQSKLPASGPMFFSDWERTLRTLTVLVTSWGRLAAPQADVRSLQKLIANVLAPNHKVRTSERVRQDASVARVALTQALGTAFAQAKVSDATWAAFRKAVSSDERAAAAVDRAQK